MTFVSIIVKHRWLHDGGRGAPNQILLGPALLSWYDSTETHNIINVSQAEEGPPTGIFSQHDLCNDKINLGVEAWRVMLIGHP